MSVVFLIGGTGNQLFQYVTSKEDDTFVTFFLRRKVRSILGWTKHEQILDYPTTPALFAGFAFIMLCIDFFLAKVSGRTLCAVIDTRSVKASKPIFKEFVRLGYFQAALEQRDLDPIAQQVTPQPKFGSIVLHVRGGDLLALERAGKNLYGMLASDYYCRAIKIARDAIAAEGRAVEQILVLTDDPEYASTLDFQVDNVPKPEIHNASLAETLNRSVGAEFYISSNSTMSYWIVRLRLGNKSFAPKPFQKHKEFVLPESVSRLCVKYS